MRGSELRDAILAVAKNQAEFGRLLGVSNNAVTGWIKNGAPGYVLAYLRLHGEFRVYRERVAAVVKDLVEKGQ